MKLAILSFLFIASVFAADIEGDVLDSFDTSTMDLEDRKVDIKKEAPWRVDLSVTGMQFRPNFQVSTSYPLGKGFNNEAVLVFGPTLEFGRDYYLSERFSASTRLQTFYGTGNDKKDLQADPTLTVSISRRQADVEMLGAGLVQSFGYDFLMSSFIVRPFVSYAVGYGGSSSHLIYGYNLSGSGQEGYDVKVQDRYVYNTLSIGTEFIAQSGISSQILLSRTGYLSGTSQAYGKTSFNNVNALYDTGERDVNTGKAIYSLSIGLGYYF